jgi:hypothetical protein
MIELVFVVCLRLDPLLCEERTLPPFIDVTESQCMTGAQAVLARWSARHPDLQIAGWSCRLVADERDASAPSASPSSISSRNLSSSRARWM